MPATGLQESRLSDAIMQRLKAEIDAREKDEEGKDTPLRKVAIIIAEEVLREVREAIVTVSIPTGSVIQNVSGGSGAPAVGIPNSAPIQVDNSISGGLS